MVLSKIGWFYRKWDDFIGNQMIWSRKLDFYRKINWNRALICQFGWFCMWWWLYTFRSLGCRDQKKARRTKGLNEKVLALKLLYKLTLHVHWDLLIFALFSDQATTNAQAATVWLALPSPSLLAVVKRCPCPLAILHPFACFVCLHHFFLRCFLFVDGLCISRFSSWLGPTATVGSCASCRGVVWGWSNRTN